MGNRHKKRHEYFMQVNSDKRRVKRAEERKQMVIAKHKTRKHTKDMFCPEHGTQLVVQQDSRFGALHVCMEDGCTVLCWSGKTSTPANKDTRIRRAHAHAMFDWLWKNNGKWHRSDAYDRLRRHLDIMANKTHIGMFDYDTCTKVMHFALDNGAPIPEGVTL